MYLILVGVYDGSMDRERTLAVAYKHEQLTGKTVARKSLKRNKEQDNYKPKGALNIYIYIYIFEKKKKLKEIFNTIQNLEMNLIREKIFQKLLVVSFSNCL